MFGKVCSAVNHGIDRLNKNVEADICERLPLFWLSAKRIPVYLSYPVFESCSWTSLPNHKQPTQIGHKILRTI